ncbi:hypothetical protein OAT84_02065 [Gammaproteobacteria bacterium]|nr:hypothetical protein [Gammaproteobacteria bacterium]
MKTTCETLIWGSKEMNILKSLKGLSPGHTALSFMIENPNTEVIQRSNELSELGLPISRFSRDGEDILEVYFSFSHNELPVNNKVKIKRKFNLNNLIKAVSTLNPYFKKLSTIGEHTYYNTRTEDYIDERSGRPADLTAETMTEDIKSNIHARERRKIIEDSAKRNRLGHSMPLYQKGSNIQQEIELTDEIKNKIRTILTKQEIKSPDVKKLIAPDSHIVERLLAPEKLILMNILNTIMS